MPKKIGVQPYRNQPRWHLDGRLLEGHVVLIRGGHEMHGMVTFEGDTPPGTPIFQWLPQGLTELIDALINIEADEFRWPSDEEQKHVGPHPPRRLS